MEWTKEQRELPPLDIIEADRREVNRRSFGPTVSSTAFVCRERQLTAALDENARLKAQMGELAVGGADEWMDREHLRGLIAEYEAIPLSQLWPTVVATYFEAIRATARKILSAPPSGEQGANRDKRLEMDWRNDVAVEVQSPKGDGEQSQVEGFPVEISLGDGFPAQTALSAEAPILAPSGEQAAPVDEGGKKYTVVPSPYTETFMTCEMKYPAEVVNPRKGRKP